mgnify:CR=1 FL=1
MKLVFISSLSPQGHYSSYVTQGLNQIKDIQLIVYADKNKSNLNEKHSGKVLLVWDKSFLYLHQIIKQLYKDKPNIVHLQQELNMFGGVLTVILFPFLLIALRLMQIKTIVTIHSAVDTNQINNNFVKLFHKNPKYFKPIFLKLVFHYLFKSISFFSDKIIVHTNLTKNTLGNDYSVNLNKILVIPHVIPSKHTSSISTKKYFFYFGYLVRRKGLENLINGFKKYLTKNPKTDFKLILAGGTIPGQELARDEILKTIKNSNNKIIYKGFVNSKTLNHLYKQAYCIVLPAHISIAASGPLAHARSHGKCVIATQTGHLNEEITNNKTGILTNNDFWDKAFETAVVNKSLIKKIEKQSIQLAQLHSPYKTALRHYNEAYS